ncbi:MAG TPA: hypothetical protein VHU41_00700, partial [Thermoanaerobaculia bacterium]|nr:hypothetical protein [Thermoanaerobaculia bacterium]
MRALVATCLFLFAFEGLAATASYDLRYDGGHFVHVEASLPAGDGRLLIAQGGGIDQLPNQWATFVHITEPANAPLVGSAGWTTDADRPIAMRYDVDLDYAVGQWPAGNEQSGRLFANALYSVTKPFFIYTSATTDARVRFKLPPGWRTATPWARAEGGEFVVPSIERLTLNSVVLGIFPTASLHTGPFDITVATPGFREVPLPLQRALKTAGTVAARIFDKTPRGKYLMTFFREDSEDGESYADSAAITSPDPFDQAGMIVTGNTIVHELLHHWLGGQIAPAEHDSMAWFTEGFTEYYANVSLARSGVVAPELLLRKFNNQVSGYLYFCESSLFHGVTVSEAGKKKGAYRFGVYNAGWVVALSLDAFIRTHTANAKSLDDAMRLLYERNGLTRQPLTIEDVAKAVEDVAHASARELLAKYVEQRNELPIAATIEQLGLTLRGQPYAAD